jgi:hypothetical protein
VTAIRDRQSDPDANEIAVPWDARALVGSRQGLPWWVAVLLAFGLALIGAIADMKLQNSLGWLFKGCYFVGAVGAVCAVQRRSLFGPMVQPPLILAITVPGVVLLVSGTPASSDTLAKALAVGTPLINGFPTMAVTSGLTLVIGIFRIYRERDPNAAAKGSKKVAADRKRPPGKAGPRDGAEARSGRSARDAAARKGAVAREGVPGRDGAPGRETVGAPVRGRRPAEGRPPAGRGPAAEPQHPSPPTTRRARPDEPPRRGEPGPRAGDPGAMGGKTPPPPGARRPRPPKAAPEQGDRRRAGEPGADRPRRLPPRSTDPRRGQGGEPRRGGPPPRRRPWEDEA